MGVTRKKRRAKFGGGYYPGYVITWTDEYGRRHERKIDGTKENAKEALRRELHDRDERKRNPLARRGTGDELFSDFARRYVDEVAPNMKAERQFRNRVKLWLEWMPKGTRLCQIDHELVRKHRKWRADEGRSVSTINHDVQVLKQILNAAASSDWNFVLPFNPLIGFKKLRGEGRRTRHATMEEVGRLLRACEDGPPYLHPLVALALMTALRQGELCALTWDDVDLRRRTIRLGEQKNSTIGEVLEISAEATTLLREWRMRSGARGSHVFMTSRGVPLKGWDSIRSAFKTALKVARIEDLWFHDLRRTWATLASEAGKSLQEISRVLRHSSTAVTERYAQVSDERRRATVEAVQIGAKSGKRDRD